jgi:hypothetical protein
LFDDNGNQTGYAFTTNPGWEIVDAILARKIKPDYNIDYNNGPTPLTASEAARFNWDSIYNAAQYYDQYLANGRRRFTFNGNFTSAGTLNGCCEPILLASRSYLQESAGQIYLNCDQPRPSYFTFTRKHDITLQPTDKNLHAAPNRFIGQFRDLLVPDAADIQSIAPVTAIVNVSGDGQTVPQVTTKEVHPFVGGDNVYIGGTGSIYDGAWVVLSVPDTVDANNNPDPTTLTLTPKASGYTATVGAVGCIGLSYSRFKERSPEFPHKRNQLARGAIGVGIPRQRNMIKQSYDLSVCTWDQASRIMQYERDRLLGVDVDPYVTPASLVLKVPYFAADAAGNLASALQPGDVVTIDSTASVTYAGEYEIQAQTVRPMTAQASVNGNSITLAASPDGGELELELQAFSTSYMYDSSDDTQAGWTDVPGSDPGNEGAYSGGTTQSNTIFAFVSGALAAGGSFQLPSVGLSTSNVLAWASPQSYLPKFMPPVDEGPEGMVLSGAVICMQYIELCEVDSNLRVQLQYTNGAWNISDVESNLTWGGPVNYFAIAWATSSSIVISSAGGWTWLELTLANGEVVCFGQGIVANGAAIPALPAGFTTAQMLAMAFLHDSGQNGMQLAHSVCSWVDANGTVHCLYSSTANSSAATWGGNASVLVFAWKNNSGAVVVTEVAGGTWMTVADTPSTVFGVGMARVTDGNAFPLPSAAGAATTLQTITSPRSIQTLGTSDDVDPSPGISSCYMDNSNIVHMQYGEQKETGEEMYTQIGVSGDAMCFGMVWETSGASSGSSSGPNITVTPAAASIDASGGYQQFTATVVGESVNTVNWSVDGIAGGNSTVGLISALGVYSAPTTAGTHTITATSTASSTLTVNATVTVIVPTIIPVKRDDSSTDQSQG